jgi:tetratricopeptide (TPR) repeat protein
MPMCARFFVYEAIAIALATMLSLGELTHAREYPAEAGGHSGQHPSAAPQGRDPQALFAKGRAALQSGDLGTAEAAFRQVIAMDPRAGAAYSNLGVIAMRRKEWDHAISLLHKAARLEPKMAGIRLNIGLVEYRRGNYAAAIAPLSSVLRDQPDSQQARYLLGLCHFLAEHYPEAVSVLEPLWPSMSSDFMYLYVLGNAAHSAQQTNLDEKALNRLVEVGGDTAQFHLIMGKAYLNRQEPERALAELERAESANPDLPFVHFNLGMAFMRTHNHDNERAAAEFLKDIAIEPDLPDNYEQLGVLYQRMEKYDDAEKSFRDALQRDVKRPRSYFGLAKIHQLRGKYQEALRAIDDALRLAPDGQSVHYVRAQILTKLGRREEAQAEFSTVKKIHESNNNKDLESFGEGRVPNPELTQRPLP